MVNYIKYLILLNIFLIPFFLGKFYIYPMTVFFIFNLVILLIYLFTSFKKNYIRVRYDYFQILFLLFIIISIISFSYSFNYFSTRDELIKLVSYLLFSLLIINILQKEDITKVFYTIILSAFMITLYGVYIYVLLSNPDYLIFSTFFNPNELAGFLIMCIPINIFFFLIHTERFKKLKFFLIFIIITIGLLLTGSRAAILSLIISLIILFLIINKEYKKQLIIIFLTLFLLLMILFSTKQIIREKFITFFNPSHRSHLFRILVAKGAINIIKQRPMVGFGLGSFQFIYPYYKLGGVNTQMVHNTYLQQWCELGLVGFFIFVSFITYILLHQVKLSKNNLIISVLLSSCLTFIIHNLFDYTFYIPAISLFFFIILSCFILSKDSTSIQIKKYLLIIPTCILFIPLTFFTAKVGLANFYAECASDLFEFENKPKKAITLFKKACKLDKVNSEYYYNLGMIYRTEGENGLAEDALIKAIKLQPKNTYYHYELGLVYYQLNNIELAKSEFIKSASLHKTYTLPLRCLGNIYLEENNKEKAIYYFKKIVDIGNLPYESSKYDPIEGREINPDFEYAKKILNILRSVQRKF